MLLITNARIHTLDPARPDASAIAIDGERIVAIGDDASLLSRWEDCAQIVNLERRTIIPGLVDAHLHLQQYALSLQTVNCETKTRAECLDRVAERARKARAGEWILGHGWNQNDWPEGFGSAAHLDPLTPHNPVYLTARSLHAAWVNSAALRLAGISPETDDPPGGCLQRNAAGDPTGILFESAMELISERIPTPNVEDISTAIRDALPGLWGMGLTGAHDFDRRDCFSALQILRAAGELKFRVVKSIPLENLPQAVELGLRTGFGDDYLRIGSVKAFADGALGPHTAAMFQPYEGEPGNRGILLLDGEELFERGRQAVAYGLSLAVHAIGDRANHEVLNAFEQIRNFEAALRRSGDDLTQRSARLRHRIEHVQIIHPDDLPRLASLDVIASLQPIHATSDYPMADRFWGTRARHSYAWRSILDASVRVAFGSDAPVESPNPFWGIHAAVTRRRIDGSPGAEGWYPDQRLHLPEALYGFTRGPAYAAGMEDRLGILAPHFLADLLVLDRDLFTCAMDDICQVRPVATMVGGRWVYADSSLAELILP
jgi:hypothetical protein